MELWQRLKDLEKKVQEQSERLKALQIAAPQAVSTEPSSEPVDTQPAVAAVTKHKPCPKCGKAAARYFHVKYCKGNADLA
jgi:NMD protein affecting ribosome stability and mRNA decay